MGFASPLCLATDKLTRPCPSEERRIARAGRYTTPSHSFQLLLNTKENYTTAPLSLSSKLLPTQVAIHTMGCQASKAAVHHQGFADTNDSILIFLSKAQRDNPEASWCYKPPRPHPLLANDQRQDLNKLMFHAQHRNNTVSKRDLNDYMET